MCSHLRVACGRARALNQQRTTRPAQTPQRNCDLGSGSALPGWNPSSKRSEPFGFRFASPRRLPRGKVFHGLNWPPSLTFKLIRRYLESGTQVKKIQATPLYVLLSKFPAERHGSSLNISSLCVTDRESFLTTAVQNFLIILARGRGLPP